MSQDPRNDGTDMPPGGGPPADRPVLVELEPEASLRLIAPGGVGRVAFNAQDGPTVLPVNYTMADGAIVFRTRYGGAMDQELRTGLKDVEFKIAFEVDRLHESFREGWSVLIQGPAHHVTEDELPTVIDSGVAPWAGGERDLYVRIIPHRITGRRIHSH